HDGRFRAAGWHHRRDSGRGSAEAPRGRGSLAGGTPVAARCPDPGMARGAGGQGSALPGLRRPRRVRDMGSRRRRLILAAIGAIAWTSLVPPGIAAEAKLGRAEWTAIKKVIGRQLVALRAGDGERAFSYASPGIRAQFGDAQRFMTMVRSGYS